MRWSRHGQSVLHHGQGLAEAMLAADSRNTRMQLLLLSLRTILRWWISAKGLAETCQMLCCCCQNLHLQQGLNAYQTPLLSNLGPLVKNSYLLTAAIERVLLHVKVSSGQWWGTTDTLSALMRWSFFSIKVFLVKTHWTSSRPIMHA